ncbi:MAG TPA: A24 family peptidase [Pseudonocardiaceae bacterium]
MDLVWAVTGAVLGLVAGAALRGPAHRLSVASGTPWRTACPACGRPYPGPLTPRCAGCGDRPLPMFVVELATAATLALVLGRLAGRWEVAAFAVLAVLGVLLSVVDLTVRRLPDRVTLPAYPLVFGLLTVAAVAGDDPGALLRSALGGLVLAAAYLALALLRPGHLGGGDVKLAGLLGLALGWLGWHALLWGTTLAFVLFALVGLALLATRRITARSHLPFGPFMLAATLLTVLL